MELLQPNGKPIVSPDARKMPTRQEKFNMVFMMFTLMSSEERQQLVKTLRPLRRQLDITYPQGMNEEAMKHELEAAANEIIPNEPTSPEPPHAEIVAEQQFPIQPQGNEGSAESAQGGPQS